MHPTSDPQAEFDALLELTARFEEARLADPVLAQAELDKLLRHVPGKRVIFRGRLAERTVIFRMFLSEAEGAAQREWDEMTRIWPAMNSGPYRIAEPVHICAAHNLLVVEAIAGVPMFDQFGALSSEDRQERIKSATAWLKAYTDPTISEAPARPGVWLDRAKAASAQQPHASLKAREETILAHLTKLAEAAEQGPWRKAICHGDFHPNNLIETTDALVGIDLGGSSKLPIYKDIARFQMHMGRRAIWPSGKTRFGVDAQGFDDFANAFELTPFERETVLPFMLGIEALLRVEGPSMNPSRIKRAGEMYDHLIADLAQL